MRAERARRVAAREAILERARAILIEDLSVSRAPDELDPDAPLFAAGLGLDSVDAIELVVAIEAAFDVRLPEGDDLGAALGSLNRIVDHVLAARDGGSP